MILPSKHISYGQALLSVGARILPHLSQEKTVSALWEELLKDDVLSGYKTPLHFDRYILALDLLFLMEAIGFEDGLLIRRKL